MLTVGYRIGLWGSRFVCFGSWLGLIDAGELLLLERLSAVLDSKVHVAIPDRS